MRRVDRLVLDWREHADRREVHHAADAGTAGRLEHVDCAGQVGLEGPERIVIQVRNVYVTSGMHNNFRMQSAEDAQKLRQLFDGRDLD